MVMTSGTSRYHRLESAALLRTVPTIDPGGRTRECEQGTRSTPQSRRQSEPVFMAFTRRMSHLHLLDISAHDVEKVALLEAAFHHIGIGFHTTSGSSGFFEGPLPEKSTGGRSISCPPVSSRSDRTRSFGMSTSETTDITPFRGGLQRLPPHPQPFSRRLRGFEDALQQRPGGN